MEKIEFTRFIERYLDDKMQLSEKRWFEKELEGNLWLRKELELRRKANMIVSNFDAMNLRKKLIEAETRHKNTSTIEKVARKVPVNYAAVFLGLIVISTLILLSGNRFDLADYTSEAIEDYQPLSNQRSGSIISDGVITTTYRQGIESMQQSSFEAAIESFKSVIDENNNPFIYDAEYYLGLCYCNIEDKENAIATMEAVISRENKYKKDAKKLLNNLK